MGLRTLGELRDRYNFPLQTLRLIGDWLRERYEEPWSSLRFYVVGVGPRADIVFHDPMSDAVLSARNRGQAVIAFELESIAQKTAEVANKPTCRSNDQLGEISRNRFVLGNAPVLAGTRIPTAAVWDFHQAGYDTAAILREYPRLTTLDLPRALEFERERRQVLVG